VYGEQTDSILSHSAPPLFGTWAIAIIVYVVGMFEQLFYAEGIGLLAAGQQIGQPYISFHVGL
jgi:hypothetical protein